MSKLWSNFGLLCVVLVSAFLLAACTNQNYQSNSAPSATNSNSAPTAASPAKPPTAPTAKLNVNTASEQQLVETIPNLGKRMVHEFEEYRPYRSIQQFRREMGKYVSPEQVAEYEKYIFVPINFNDADAPTLQQIPGLDAAEAENVMAGRPYSSADAFLKKLADKVSPAELEVAKTYLATQ